MRALQSILLAVDFRPASQEAAKAVVRLASAFGSAVTLLHVLEPVPPAWPVVPDEGEVWAVELLRGEAARLTAQGVRVAGSAVVVGSPGDAIVRKARQIDADLVLLGAGEQYHHDHFWAGPVADAVLAHAAPPVLAVRPGEPAPRFRTILCPVDQSDVSRRGLENAIGLARTFGGEVIVLTVVPEVSWLSAAVETGRLAGARAAHEARWREEFDQFLAGVPFDGVPGSREVRHGVPHEQIVACAHEHQADVIVLGATGRTGLARVLLGSVTRRLLRRLPCSLLVVKDRDAVAAPSPEEQQVVQVLAAQGRELLAAGSLEAARERLERAVAHDPFHTAAVAGLAEALERLGRREEAAYYRRRAEALKG